MKKHVFIPLLLVLVCIGLLLVVRHMMVPPDFGVNGKNFTYGFYRLSNIDDWKHFKIKYQGREYCRECHAEKLEEILPSPHGAIECENCHGPAVDHPDDPEVLPLTTNRLLCLRCHAGLPYPQSNRADMPAVDPEGHNPGYPCVECHNPHNPDLEAM